MVHYFLSIPELLRGAALHTRCATDTRDNESRLSASTNVSKGIALMICSMSPGGSQGS